MTQFFSTGDAAKDVLTRNNTMHNSRIGLIKNSSPLPQGYSNNIKPSFSYILQIEFQVKRNSNELNNGMEIKKVKFNDIP